MSEKKPLKHIAFIMDGNGRWAKKRGLPRHLGHKAGCERVIDVYEECRKLGIKVMSLYAFSTENWSRPQAEIDHLFTYLEVFFKKEMERMKREGCRIIVSGDLTPIREKTKKVILEAIELTKDNNEFVFNICLNYGGKAEILRASKLMYEDIKLGKIKEDEINEELFENYLYTKGLPPVDFLVRTSGEMRTSNYLPWQLAYAEFYFPLTPWPDFTKEELDKAVDVYYGRDRRFGGLNYGQE